MKILYGVQATGNGHITRSREIIRARRGAGHKVLVLFSGREPERFWDIEDLRPFLMKRGLTFAVSAGKIRHWETAKQFRFWVFFRDIRTFDASDFDLVISDFEPLSVRIARRAGLTSIGIGHQYAFRYAVPAPHYPAAPRPARFHGRAGQMGRVGRPAGREGPVRGGLGQGAGRLRGRHGYSVSSAAEPMR